MRSTLQRLCLSALLFCTHAAAHPHHSDLVEGSLSAGPSDQGTCTRSDSRTDTFSCTNGSTCRWQTDSLAFSCSASNLLAADNTSGPPGRTCTSHGDHYDCDDGSLCEIVDGVWLCELSDAHSEGESGTCVVHGGHTHGDCSGSCNGVDLGNYDLDLHIVALFVVLIGSLIGVLLPVICSSVVTGRVFRGVFFATKHFGTGVIICTAFVHLLYHAFVMFGNACLGELAFEPAAAAISLAGVYVVFSVDFFVMRWLRSRGERRLAAMSAANGDSPAGSIDSSLQNEKERAHDQHDLGHCHGPAREIATDYSSAQAHFDVLILEAGIIFHSIMIGVSLGASGGDQWIPLFIAIVFHQLFEGLALGSRIGQLVWPAGKGWKKWAMALAFGLITPIGIAIGMGVHATYNPNSGASLLSIGVLDSISAGILIYTGIVECLYHDFMHGSLARAGIGRVSAALFFVLAGSLCMIVDGVWLCEVSEPHSSDSCNGVDLGDYDLKLHIIALFVVLIGSFIGVLLPIVCSTVVTGRIFRGIFFATKHFGTGVIICTAFVHLLYHGFDMFSNTCLGELAFEPAAAAISLAGVYIVFFVDFFVMRWLRSRGERRPAAMTAANGDSPAESIASSSHSEKEPGHGPHDLGHCHGPARETATDYSSAQAHFDVLILEAGIIFHSVMIGVSLGASGGDQWIPVFIAIVFHQLFEGLALGSRIAQLVWPAGKEWKKWALTLPIGLVTPIGIAIGIGLHATYNPNSSASILSIGVLDSISAGILIYTGIIECLYHDFMHGSLARAGVGRVSAALFFVLAGTLCMAVIGKWA